jgi:hypothetical protein
MSSILQKIFEFFGFGGAPKSPHETFEEMFRRLSSQKRLDECSKIAYQAVQKGDTIRPGQVHPYEGTIKAECIKVDAALSAFRNDELTRKFGDAQYLIAQINGGLSTQLSGASAAALEKQVSGAISQKNPLAEAVKAKLAESQRALHIFKGAHGITVPAQEPQALNTLYIAGAFALGEAIANMLFLRESLNMVSAFFVAFALAVINVAGNVWLGNRYRWKNHTDTSLAAKGRRNLFYAYLLTLSVGILIAVARFKIQTDIDTGFIIESVVLMAVGVALGILAFHKGYAMDDPFPGYGPLARAVDSLELEIQTMAESHASFCESVRNTAESAHSSSKSRIRSAADTLASTLPELAKSLKEWEHQRDQINDAFARQQEVFKAILSAHAKNGETYPTTIIQLPASPQLEARKEEAAQLTTKSLNINSDIEDLLRQVDNSLAELQGWMNSDPAKQLLRWPA